MPKTVNSPTAADQLVERLAGIEAATPSVVSCYLRLDPAARRNKAYLVELLQRVKQLEPTLEARGIDAAGRKRIADDVERIVRWLARPSARPSLPGIALFASKELGLFEAVPLARVHRNRIDVDKRPLLEELLDARETMGHYLGVVIDRERARFFHVTAANTQELSALVPLASRGGKFRGDRRDSPGTGEHNFHQRIEQEKNRHYASVTAEIGRLVRVRPYRGVAVFGPAMHTGALLGFFPERLRRLVLGEARLNPKSATPAEVARLTWKLQAEAERRDEGALLDRVENAVATGWAVNGVRDTLRALGRGQVRELIVPDGATANGFRCGGGQLALETADCRDGGDARPVAHLVDEAIEDALRQRSEVIVVDDKATAARIDGLAATLRFRSR